MPEREDYESALRQVAMEGDVDGVLELMTEGVDIEAGNEIGNRPLHLGAYYGHEEVVEVLMRSQAELEATNTYGHSPLQLACMSGHLNIVDMLVSAGVELDYKSEPYSGMTALHYASKAGHPNVCQYLLDVGATEEIFDYVDNIPEFYAANYPTELVFRKRRWAEAGNQGKKADNNVTSPAGIQDNNIQHRDTAATVAPAGNLGQRPVSRSSDQNKGHQDSKQTSDTNTDVAPPRSQSRQGNDNNAAPPGDGKWAEPRPGTAKPNDPKRFLLTLEANPEPQSARVSSAGHDPSNQINPGSKSARIWSAGHELPTDKKSQPTTDRNTGETTEKLIPDQTPIEANESEINGPLGRGSVSDKDNNGQGAIKDEKDNDVTNLGRLGQGARQGAINNYNDTDKQPDRNDNRKNIVQGENAGQGGAPLGDQKDYESTSKDPYHRDDSQDCRNNNGEEYLDDSYEGSDGEYHYDDDDEDDAEGAGYAIGGANGRKGRKPRDRSPGKYGYSPRKGQASMENHGKFKYDRDPKKWDYKRGKGGNWQKLKDHEFEWSDKFKNRQNQSVYDRLLGGKGGNAAAVEPRQRPTKENNVTKASHVIRKWGGNDGRQNREYRYRNESPTKPGGTEARKTRDLSPEKPLTYPTTRLRDSSPEKPAGSTTRGRSPEKKYGWSDVRQEQKKRDVSPTKAWGGNDGKQNRNFREKDVQPSRPWGGNDGKQNNWYRFRLEQMFKRDPSPVKEAGKTEDGASSKPGASNWDKLKNKDFDWSEEYKNRQKQSVYNRLLGGPKSLKEAKKSSPKEAD